MPERFGAGRAAAFAAGLGIVLLALAPPIDAWATGGSRRTWPASPADGGGAAASLAGAPWRRCLQGCASRAARGGLDVASRARAAVTGALTNPRVAWVRSSSRSGGGMRRRCTTWRSDRTSGTTRHACFFVTALLFWHR